MKLDILAFGVHPDDVDLGCGATLAKAAAAGKKVGIIDLTQGELGTRGTAETRLKEANKAKEILGAVVRENLKMRDGFFENNEANQMKIIQVIRKFQPNIIITNAPTDRHPDHGRACELTKQASFLSGLKRIETGQEEWRPNRMFSYIQWQSLQPDFVVDVTGYLATKVDACLAFASQFHDPNSEEPDTAISSKNFKESIEYRAKDLGRLIWTDAAEGFISHSLLGVDNLQAFL